jgi:hypothetical protein
MEYSGREFGEDLTTAVPVVDGACKCPDGYTMAPNPGGQEMWAMAGQAAKAKGTDLVLPGCPDFRCVATDHPLTKVLTSVAPAAPAPVVTTEPGAEASVGDWVAASVAAHPWLWMGGAVLVAFLGGRTSSRYQGG